MNFYEVLESWKNEMELMELEIDIEGFKNLQEIDNYELMTPYEIAEELIANIEIMIKFESVGEYFHKKISDDEVKAKLILYYGIMAIDSGEIELINFKPKEPPKFKKRVIENLLIDICGEERKNTLLVMNIFSESKLWEVLDNEIDKELNRYFSELIVYTKEKIGWLRGELTESIISSSLMLHLKESK